MKKYLVVLITIAVLLIAVIYPINLSQLNKKINSLENNINTQFSHLENNIRFISSDVQNALDEQSSLLADATWEFGAADMAKHHVEVICSVSPKQYTPGSTTASIICNGKEYPMTLENNRYVAALTIPLIDESKVDSVIFHNEDVIYTQSLDWILCPRYEYLLSVYANFNGSGHGTTTKEIYQDTRTGLIVIDINAPNETTVKNIDIVTLLNGKEQSRTAIDLSYKGQTAYMQANSGNSLSYATSIPEHNYYTEGKASQYFYYIDETYQLTPGSTLLIYADVTDSLGFSYRTLCDLITYPDNDSDYTDKYWMISNESSIYDSTGKLIYAPDEELYL